MNLKNLLYGLFALAILAGFSACDDDDVTLTTSDLTMSFEYLVNGQPYTAGEVYTIGGTAVSFDIVHFYVGGIKLHPEEGDHVHFEDKYLLVKPGSGEQEVGTVDKGHFHMAQFFVGVSPEDNDQTEQDFDSRPETDPLSRQEPAMHWNWNSGYRFIRIDGMVDTDGDNVPDTAMEYHLGTDNFLTDLSFMHLDIEDNKQDLGFTLEIADLFDGINLSEHYSMHTGDEPDIAAQFAGNVAGAFSKK